jgi:hypothetical protein
MKLNIRLEKEKKRNRKNICFFMCPCISSRLEKRDCFHLVFIHDVDVPGALFLAWSTNCVLIWLVPRYYNVYFVKEKRTISRPYPIIYLEYPRLILFFGKCNEKPVFIFR